MKVGKILFSVAVLGGIALPGRGLDFTVPLTGEIADASKLPGIRRGRGTVYENDGKYRIRMDEDSYLPLVMDTPPVITPEKGMIAFEFTPLFRGMPEGKSFQAHRILTSWSGKDWVSIGVNEDADGKTHPYFLVMTPNAKNYGPYGSCELIPGRNYKFAATWNRERMNLYLDGKLLSSKPYKVPLPWGKEIILGSLTGQLERARGYLADIRFSDTLPAMEKSDIVTFVPEKQNAQYEIRLLEDTKKHFICQIGSPDSKGEVTIRPAAFPIKSGETIYVHHSTGENLDVRAETSGEIRFGFSPSLNRQLELLHSEPNLIEDPSCEGPSKWKTGHAKHPFLTTGDPYVPCGISYNSAARNLEYSPMPFSSEAARTGKQSIRISPSKDGGTNLAVSPWVAVRPGERYAFTCFQHSPDITLGGGIAAGVQISENGDEGKILNFLPFQYPNAMDKGQWEVRRHLFTVPADLKNPMARIMVSATGRPHTVYWDDFDLRVYPDYSYIRKKPLTPEQVTPVISAEELRKRLASQPPHQVESRRINGRPVMMIDGKPQPYFGLYSYPDSRACRFFDEAGINLQWIITYSGYRATRFWIGPGKFDFTRFDMELERALRLAPDAKIMLSLMCDPYRDFYKDFPQAMAIGPHGKKCNWRFHEVDQDNDADYFVPSYCSKDYQREMAVMLKAFAKHIQESPYGKAVIGIHIGGGNDNQWFPPHYDACPDAVAAFREFIRARYHNDLTEFRKAWGNPDLTFETIPCRNYEQESEGNGILLNPDSPKDRAQIDFNTWRSQMPLPIIELAAKTLREAFTDRHIWLSIYYPDSSEGNCNGKDRFDEIMRDGCIDGIASCLHYGEARRLGEEGSIENAAGSVSLHGKLLMGELDYRGSYTGTAKWGADYDFHGAGGVWGRIGLHSQGIRDLGGMLANGQGAWCFILSGVAWGDSVLQNYLREENNAAKLAVQEPDGKDRSALKVFYDMDTSGYSRKHLLHLIPLRMGYGELFRVLARCGIGFDGYSLADLTDPARPEGKIYLFPLASNITPEQVAYIQKNLQKNGNVIIFAFDAGRLSPLGIRETVRRTTGIEVTPRLSEQTVSRNALTSPWKEMAYLGCEANVPVIAVTDPQAEPVAYFRYLPAVVSAAVKRHRDWTGVYVSAPGAITPEFLHRLAEQSGVEPVSDTFDTLFCGNGFIVMHALHSGPKTIRWEKPCDLIDPGTGRVLVRNAKSFRFDLRVGESRWFKKVPPSKE